MSGKSCVCWKERARDGDEGAAGFGVGAVDAVDAGMWRQPSVRSSWRSPW